MNKFIGAACLIATLVAAGWWMLRMNASDSRPIPAKPGATAKQADDMRFDDAAVVQSLAPEVIAMNKAPPIKSSAEPLAGRIADLDGRAKAGDAAAALQLSLDLKNCADQSERKRHVDGLIRDAAVGSNSERRDRLQLAEVFMGQYKAAAAACAGVTPAQMHRRFALLEQAADAGNEQAQLAYRHAGSPLIGDAQAMLLNPQALLRFTRRAAQFTQAAARNCNRMAIYLLAEDYSAGRFVDHDPVSALAMRYVLDQSRAGNRAGQSADPMIRSAAAAAAAYESSVTATQRAQARRHAEQFHARYCRGG